MTNTARSFNDKWRENPQLGLHDVIREGSDTQRWILDRNGFANVADLSAYLKTRPRILDAGCGNGRVTRLLQLAACADAEIVGIDLVAADVARNNLASLPNVRIFPEDLLGNLSHLGEFDFIYCQEVLHHTGDARRAFLNLTGLLAECGEIAIYVYRVKAPIREFTDDFVRDRIAAMPYEEARLVSSQITELGRILSELQSDGKPIRVQIPAVPVLGIEAGVYDLQRFFYHFFMKCYWNPELSPNDNIAINYDWYHPQDATRHERDEVLEWFAEAGLVVVHSHLDPYGITVRGKRPTPALQAVYL